MIPFGEEQARMRDGGRARRTEFSKVAGIS